MEVLANVGLFAGQIAAVADDVSAVALNPDAADKAAGSFFDRLNVEDKGWDRPCR